MQLWTCDNTSSLQAWFLETPLPPPNAHITLQSSRNASTGLWLVLGVSANVPGSDVLVSYNATGSAADNQQWLHVNENLVNRANGLRLTSALPVAGSGLSMQPCTKSRNQTFLFDSLSGQFYTGFPSLCLDAGSSVSCESAPLNASLFCNPDAPTADRVADLVPRILPEEYPQLLANTGFGVPVCALAIPHPLGDTL